jgi:hypothetical protein
LARDGQHHPCHDGGTQRAAFCVPSTFVNHARATKKIVNQKIKNLSDKKWVLLFIQGEQKTTALTKDPCV